MSEKYYSTNKSLLSSNLSLKLRGTNGKPYKWNPTDPRKICKFHIIRINETHLGIFSSVIAVLNVGQQDFVNLAPNVWWKQDTRHLMIHLKRIFLDLGVISALPRGKDYFSNIRHPEKTSSAITKLNCLLVKRESCRERTWVVNLCTNINEWTKLVRGCIKIATVRDGVLNSSKTKLCLDDLNMHVGTQRSFLSANGRLVVIRRKVIFQIYVNIFRLLLLCKQCIVGATLQKLCYLY